MATNEPVLVNAGGDAMGAWEIWQGWPPLERQTHADTRLSPITEGEFRGLYLLEWYW